MPRRSKTALISLIIFIVLAGGGLIAYSLISGLNLGIRNSIGNIPRSAISAMKALANHQNVIADNRGEYTNIIFLHHSVGANLIADGNLREELTNAGYTFYDHGYNDTGLTGPDGAALGYSYNVPDDNTDPEGLSDIFRQKVYSLPINTISGLLQHEVIIIKSCYTGSQISSAEQLAKDKASYLEIRESMAKHPDKMFIILTSPPLNQAETDPAEARRAYDLARWLSSPEFISGYGNMFVFDLYGLLAENLLGAADEHTLKAEYRNGSDSHPNQMANEIIGPTLVTFVLESIRRYRWLQ